MIDCSRRVLVSPLVILGDEIFRGGFCCSTCGDLQRPEVSAVYHRCSQCGSRVELVWKAEDL